MNRTTWRRHASTWPCSAPTWLTPSVARCQRSWSSHSAIDTLNLFCTRALMARSTLRLPFSEWFSGRSSSRRRTPTTMPAGDASGLALGGLGDLAGLTTLGASGREPARDLLDLVALDDVADLDVLEVLEADSALVTAGDLAHVLLEATEAPHAPVVHDHVVAQQAHLAAALHLALGDEASGDDALARHGEGLPHLRASEHLFLPGGLEQPLERVAQVVQRVVDDGVEPDVDALALGEPGRLRLRPHVETDDDGIRRRRQQHIRLRDPAHRAVDDVQTDVVRRQPAQRFADRFQGALHVGLHDHLQLADVAALDLLVEVVEGDLRGLRHLGVALLAAAVLGHLPRLGVVLDGDEDVAGVGHAAQPGDLAGRRRTGRGDAPSLVAHHGADAAELDAADERVPDVERALLHEDRRHRPAAAIEARLDDGPLGEPLRVGFQLEHVGLQEDHLEQLVDALLRLRRHRHHDGVSAPLLGGEPEVAELLLHTFR